MGPTVRAERVAAEPLRFLRLVEDGLFADLLGGRALGVEPRQDGLGVTADRFDEPVNDVHGQLPLYRESGD